MRNRLLALVVVVGCFISVSGCGTFRQPVTLELTGRYSHEDAETLTLLLSDSKGYCGWYKWSGESPSTFYIGPVENPESLRDRVKFGKVEAITGRAVTISVDESALRIQAFTVRSAQWLSSVLSTNVRTDYYLLRSAVKAWWLGKQVLDVIWNDPDAGRICGWAFPGRS